MAEVQGAADMMRPVLDGDMPFDFDEPRPIEYEGDEPGEFDDALYQRALAAKRAELGLSVTFDEAKHPRGLRGRFIRLKYRPDFAAPPEGEYVWDGDVAVGWRRGHRELVSEALHRWKGWPSTAVLHMREALDGAPQPDSGSGKQMRAEAEALLWELLHKSRPNDRALYRGSNADPAEPSAWSERRAVANHWAKEGGGQVRVLRKGEGRGIRIADYIGSSGLDESEREWIVLPPDWAAELEAEPPPEQDVTDAEAAALMEYEFGYGGGDGPFEAGEALRVARGDRSQLTPGQRESLDALTSLIDRHAEDAPPLYRVVDGSQLSGSGWDELHEGGTFVEHGITAGCPTPQHVGDWIEDKASAGAPVRRPVVFHLTGARGLHVLPLVEQHVEEWGGELPEEGDPGFRASYDEWLVRPGARYRVRQVQEGPELVLVTAELLPGRAEAPQGGQPVEGEQVERPGHKDGPLIILVDYGDGTYLVELGEGHTARIGTDSNAFLGTKYGRDRNLSLAVFRESLHPRGVGGRWVRLKDVLDAHPDVEVSASEAHGGLVISMLRTEGDARGKGKASKALSDLLDYADERQLTVALTPEKVGTGGLSNTALTKWYRSRGFVPNKGRNKDWAFTEAMVRPPAEPPLRDQVLAVRAEVAQQAQEAYDEWEQDEDGLDEVYGGGGICDEIAARIGGVLSARIDGAQVVDAGQPGDDHAYVLVFNQDEAYAVDIPHGLYEEGGGYSWRKIEGVRFRPEDVEVYDVDPGLARELADALEEEGHDLSLAVFKESLHPRGLAGRFISVNPGFLREAEAKHPEAAVDVEAAVRMQAVLDESDVAVRTYPEGLLSILRKGRWTNPHEEDAAANGATDWALPGRLKYEPQMWDLEGRPFREWPIYGYAAPRHERGIGGEDDQGLGPYGHVKVTLRPEVKDRTTVTLGDTVMAPTAFPSPWNDVQPITASGFAGRPGEPIDTGVYVEAQVLGGLSADDIESVTFGLGEPDEELRRELEVRGIPWSVDRYWRDNRVMWQEGFYG